jgi:hypothetical protein
MDIVVWLRSLGLGKYEAAFREGKTLFITTLRKHCVLRIEKRDGGATFTHIAMRRLRPQACAQPQKGG